MRRKPNEKKGRILNLSIEVQRAIQRLYQDDYFCEFIFMFNNRSDTHTSVYKIGYSLPKDSPHFNNPVLNILQEPIHVKTQRSEKIKNSFQYIELPDKSHVEITFYHTHGEESIEATISKEQN